MTIFAQTNINNISYKHSRIKHCAKEAASLQLRGNQYQKQPMLELAC